MRFRCEHCGAEHNLRNPAMCVRIEERLKEGPVRLRCKQCGSGIVLRPGEVSSDASQPLPQMNAQSIPQSIAPQAYSSQAPSNVPYSTPPAHSPSSRPTPPGMPLFRESYEAAAERLGMAQRPVADFAAEVSGLFEAQLDDDASFADIDVSAPLAPRPRMTTGSRPSISMKSQGSMASIPISSIPIAGQSSRPVMATPTSRPVFVANQSSRIEAEAWKNASNPNLVMAPERSTPSSGMSALNSGMSALNSGMSALSSPRRLTGSFSPAPGAFTYDFYVCKAAGDPRFERFLPRALAASFRVFSEVDSPAEAGLATACQARVLLIPLSDTATHKDDPFVADILDRTGMPAGPEYVVPLMIDRTAPPAETPARLRRITPVNWVGGDIQRLCSRLAAYLEPGGGGRASDDESEIMAKRLAEAGRRMHQAQERGEPLERYQAELDLLEQQARSEGRIAAGATIAGRYRLEAILAEGTVTTAWRAFDVQTASKVVLQILRPEVSSDVARRESIFARVTSCAHLQYAGISKILVPRGEERGLDYFVTTFAEGGTLEQLVARGACGQGDIIDIISDVAKALSYAHRHGCLHLDLSPRCIVVDGTGRIQICDFGLADATATMREGGAGLLARLTYWAPELFDDKATLTASADLYSLALCAVYLWLGHDLPAMALRAPERVVLSLDCPESLRTLLISALSFEPEGRPANADAFDQALNSTSRAKDLPQTEMRAALKFISGGRYKMGSEPNQGDDCEQPAHEVLVQPFYIGVTPVTQAEFEAVMGYNPARNKGPLLPVEQIDFFDAVAYCNALSLRENRTPRYVVDGERVTLVPGNGYRVPTEEEWEFACRAGSTTKYSSGDSESDLANVGWYLENSRHRTQNVGQKAQNAFGLFDMLGNVWEWCEDDFAFYGEAALDQEHKVIRGGSCWVEASGTRCASRGRVKYRDKSPTIGLRIACSLS